MSIDVLFFCLFCVQLRSEGGTWSISCCAPCTEIIFFWVKISLLHPLISSCTIREEWSHWDPLGKTLGTDSLFGFEMASIVSWPCRSSEDPLQSAWWIQQRIRWLEGMYPRLSKIPVLARSFTVFELKFPRTLGIPHWYLSTWCSCRSYLSLFRTQRCVWRRLWRYHQEWSPKWFDHIRSNKKERLERVSRVLRSNIWYYYLIYLIQCGAP